MSTSETIETKITTSVWHLIFYQEDSVRDPQTLVQSLATMTTPMPAINIGTLFSRQEDQEGNDGSGVVTEDDDGTDLEGGGYARDFLEVVLRRLWEGRFGRRRMTMKTTETSRDDKHEEEDVITRSMFETLCEGEPSSSLFTACPERQLLRQSLMVLTYLDAAVHTSTHRRM